jgi:hypothetical protein
MEITNEKYQELVEAKATLDLLTKLYAGLASYQFDDVCKVVFAEHIQNGPQCGTTEEE